MSRSVVLLLVILAVASFVPGPDSAADQPPDRLQRVQILLETRYIQVRDGALPADIQYPKVASCRLLAPHQSALLLSAAEGNPASQMQTVENGGAGEVRFDGICLAKFHPMLSENEQTIRLGLRVLQPDGREWLPGMMPEIPIGGALLVRVATLSEGRRTPSFWARLVHGERAEVLITHHLLIVKVYVILTADSAEQRV